jgi:hypothetical protein
MDTKPDQETTTAKTGHSGDASGGGGRGGAARVRYPRLPTPQEIAALQSNQSGPAAALPRPVDDVTRQRIYTLVNLNCQVCMCENLVTARLQQQQHYSSNAI